ncbi:MAG: HU family DNA-binding protein [Bacteroidetes bacterium]|nr:HU family DNA-binding protein [Bacteroidota bacterium]
MNKGDLINAMASKAGITKAQAGRALDSFIDNASSALKKGDRVALIGFGSWSVKDRAARKGRNPQTGETIQIPARRVVKWRAGSELTNSVR